MIWLIVIGYSEIRYWLFVYLEIGYLEIRKIQWALPIANGLRSFRALFYHLSFFTYHSLGQVRCLCGNIYLQNQCVVHSR